MRIRLRVLIFSFVVLAAIISCSDEAPVVSPGDVTESSSGTSPGDNIPRLMQIYPENGAADVPVGTDIVLVFSEPVDIATILPLPSSVDILPGSPTFTTSAVLNSNAVIIENITPPLAVGNYTIQINDGITDIDGTPLYTNYTRIFTIP